MRLNGDELVVVFAITLAAAAGTAGCGGGDASPPGPDGAAAGSSGGATGSGGAGSGGSDGGADAGGGVPTWCASTAAQQAQAHNPFDSVAVGQGCSIALCPGSGSAPSTVVVRTSGEYVANVCVYDATGATRLAGETCAESSSCMHAGAVAATSSGCTMIGCGTDTTDAGVTLTVPLVGDDCLADGTSCSLEEKVELQNRKGTTQSCESRSTHVKYTVVESLHSIRCVYQDSNGALIGSRTCSATRDYCNGQKLCEATKDYPLDLDCGASDAGTD
jgi:hypothetical protein